jgi:acetolactate synthase-1/2/3 large subunit
MRLSAALACALVGHGVDTLFGLRTEANASLAYSFACEQDRHYVGAMHEAGAVYMGLGYAGLSGRLAAVALSHGPALTNTVTALVEAARRRVPLLVIAVDPAAQSRPGLHTVAHRDVVLPTGAGFEQARSPRSTLAGLAAAIRRVVIERRPMVFNVPADFLDVDVHYDEVPLNLPETQAPYPDPGAVRYAASRIAPARRPVVLAGTGAIPARRQLLAFAERIGAPVATTLGAKDLFRDEPFDLGIAAEPAGAAGREVIRDADLVVAFGTNPHGYAGDGTARVVLIDTGPTTVACTCDAEVHGDAGVVAESLIAELDVLGVPPSGYRGDAMAQRLAAEAQTAPDGVMRAALRALDRILPRSRVVVADGGRFRRESLRHIRVTDSRAFVCPETLGAGMGAAVGAAAVRIPNPVVLICGDSGFMYGIGEFATAVREGLDVIVMVCGDGGNHRPPDGAAGIDLTGLAGALGGDGITIRGLDDLPAADKLVTGRSRPLLIDLRLPTGG